MKKKKSQTKIKRKNKPVAKTKKKSKKDIFLDSYCYETGDSKKEAKDKFGELEHGKMSYVVDKVKKFNPFDAIFDRTLGSILK